jgi:hypothetical protein
MAYSVVIPNMTMAQNVDALNRVAKSGESTTVDIENGSLVVLDGISATAGEGEVWLAKCPTTNTLTSAVWMVASPEIVVTTSGTNQYKGLDPDVRNFINIKDKTFDVFKLSVGDIITLSADGVEGTKSTNTYAVAADGKYLLQWSSTAISGPSLKLIETTYISIPNGTLGDTQRLTAYRFYVEKLA